MVASKSVQITAHCLDEGQGVWLRSDMCEAWSGMCCPNN